MKYKQVVSSITTCRSCGNNTLTTILTLGDIALSDFTTSGKKPLRYPLTLVFCETCSLTQLKHTIPQSELYTERYGYKSGMNKTMQRELSEIVRKSQKKIVCDHAQYTAIDIGANDGTLLRNYPKEVFTIGIEPVKKFAHECETHANAVINDFFSYRSYLQKFGNKKAHIITAISCFYDMEDPNQFILDAKQILHEHGILVIQQNYLVSMLTNNAFDNIVHEHLEYYSLLSLEHLLHKHGLEVFDVELSDINGGSFRTYIGYKGTRKVNKNVFHVRENEKRLQLHNKVVYKKFSERIKKNKQKLNTLIKNLTKKGKTIYVYGASTRGNTLLQYFNLDNCIISAAVERNPEKWGKKIASLDIPIISEDQARKEKPDYMLVLPWFFREEFLEREKEYLRSGGHFIFPLPKVEIM